MRKASAALFALALCSCHGQPPAGEAAKVPVVNAPVPDETSRVALGDAADAAHQRILRSGGREMVGIGGLYLGPGKVSYYELKDHTCVSLRIEPTEGKEAKVTRIFSGERGHGYGEKKEWHNQSREVEFIELK